MKGQVRFTHRMCMVGISILNRFNREAAGTTQHVALGKQALAKEQNRIWAQLQFLALDLDALRDGRDELAPETRVAADAQIEHLERQYWHLRDSKTVLEWIHGLAEEHGDGLSAKCVARIRFQLIHTAAVERKQCRCCIRG